MDLTAYLFAALFGIVSSAATFGGCRIWHLRRMKEARARMDKLEQSRNAANQLIQQARKQVETLQKEMAALQKARVEGQPQRSRTQAMEETLRQEAQRRGGSSSRDADGPTANGGFQQTQIDPSNNGFATTRINESANGFASTRINATGSDGFASTRMNTPAHGFASTQIDEPAPPAHGFAETRPVTSSPARRS